MGLEGLLSPRSSSKSLARKLMRRICLLLRSTVCIWGATIKVSIKAIPERVNCSKRSGATLMSLILSARKSSLIGRRCSLTTRKLYRKKSLHFSPKICRQIADIAPDKSTRTGANAQENILLHKRGGEHFCIRVRRTRQAWIEISTERGIELVAKKCWR